MAKKSNVVKNNYKFNVRRVNRCQICGRTRSFIRRFGLCRICFRELAFRGQLPGVKKASW